MPSIEDEILIQPMVQHIAMCGVATSADKDTLPLMIALNTITVTLIALSWMEVRKV